MDWETWGLPLLILSGGRSVGIFLATRTNKPDSGARPEEDLTARKEALQGIRDVLLEFFLGPPRSLVDDVVAVLAAVDQPAQFTTDPGHGPTEQLVGPRADLAGQLARQLRDR